MIRVKTRWHDRGRARPPAELGTVIAATAWRAAHQALKNLQKAEFEIVPGPAYFAVLAELLAFLLHVADRMVHPRTRPQARAELIASAVRRAAEVYADNCRELLGAAPQEDDSAHFIALYNARSGTYAEFGFQEDGENYPMLRALSYGLRDALPERDRPWVFGQVMEVEAPLAMESVRKAVVGLLAPTAE
jgi:hypothetical protein